MYNIIKLKKLHLLSEAAKEKWKMWLIHEADVNQTIKNFYSRFTNSIELLILILLKYVLLKKLGLNQEEIYLRLA